MGTKKSTHPADRRLWTPGSRSVAHPIPLGEQADRTPIGLPLWTKSHGMRHPLIGGAAGSGKTNTLNDIICGLSACVDAVIWGIEVAKAGQGSAAWVPCLDWLATTPAEAVAMLRAAVAIIDARSRRLAALVAQGKGSDKVIPSPRHPALVIILDEAAALHAVTSGSTEAMALAAEATELARRITQTGRSAAVGLLVATQRPSVASLGDDGDYRAQLHPNLCLRMNRRADVGFVLQGVDLDTVDTTLFDVPGLLYLQDGPAVQPLPVRSYALFEPSLAHRLARWYAPSRPALDPVSRDAAGAAYAERPADPFAKPPTPTKGKRGNRTEATDAPTSAAASTTRARARSSEILDNARNLVKAELPEVPALRLTELASDGEGTELAAGDASVAEVVLLVLGDAEGHEAMGMREITRGVEVARGSAHRGSVHRALRALTDAGRVHRIPSKAGYRYSIPEPLEAHAA